MPALLQALDHLLALGVRAPGEPPAVGDPARWLRRKKICTVCLACASGVRTRKKKASLGLRCGRNPSAASPQPPKRSRRDSARSQQVGWLQIMTKVLYILHEARDGPDPPLALQPGPATRMSRFVGSHRSWSLLSELTTIQSLALPIGLDSTPHEGLALLGPLLGAPPEETLKVRPLPATLRGPPISIRRSGERIVHLIGNV